MRKLFTIVKFQKGAGVLTCLVGTIILGLYIGNFFARSSQQPEMRSVKQIVATSQVNATPIDSDPMPEPDKLTQFIDNNFMLIQSKCRGVQEIIVIENLNILCIFGIIDADFLQQFDSRQPTFFNCICKLSRRDSVKFYEVRRGNF